MLITRERWNSIKIQYLRTSQSSRWRDCTWRTARSSPCGSWTPCRPAREKERERCVRVCLLWTLCACVDTVQTAAARAMRSRWINGACAALRRFARSWDWSTLNHDPLWDCGSDSNVDVGSDSDKARQSVTWCICFGAYLVKAYCVHWALRREGNLCFVMLWLIQHEFKNTPLKLLLCVRFCT